MTSADAASGGTTAPLRDIWTRVAVDPLADPLARRLYRVRWVTPNRVTAAALMCGFLAAGAFLRGWLVAGGVIFVFRFFLDCLDGKIARLQRSYSAVGAAFDVIADVLGIACCYAALGWYLYSVGQGSVGVLVALLASFAFYAWVLAYRKQLAERAGLGDGSEGARVRSSLPLLRTWIALCRRLGMRPVPWSVEVEIAALGLIPVLLPLDVVASGLVLALAFYLVGSVVNVRRVVRIAREVDSRRALPGAE